MQDILQTAFREVLKKCIERKKTQKMNQKDFAKIIKLSGTELSNILTGQENIGKKRWNDIVEKLGSSFDVDVKKRVVELIEESLKEKSAKCKTQSEYLGKYKPFELEEQKYIGLLIEIFRGSNKKNIRALKENIGAFYDTRNIKTETETNAIQNDHIKKQHAC